MLSSSLYTVLQYFVQLSDTHMCNYVDQIIRDIIDPVGHIGSSKPALFFIHLCFSSKGFGASTMDWSARLYIARR